MVKLESFQDILKVILKNILELLQMLWLFKNIYNIQHVYLFLSLQKIIISSYNKYLNIYFYT